MELKTAVSISLKDETNVIQGSLLFLCPMQEKWTFLSGIVLTVGHASDTKNNNSCLSPQLEYILDFRELSRGRTTKASKVWFSYSHNCTVASGTVFHCLPSFIVQWHTRIFQF